MQEQSYMHENEIPSKPNKVYDRHMKQCCHQTDYKWGEIGDLWSNGENTISNNLIGYNSE